MSINDRHGRLAEPRELWLELGSGRERPVAGAIGVDRLDLPEVDVVGDVFEVLRSLPDASVARVGSSHFLEHVEHLDELLAELGRVMRPGATMTAVVPHWSNPYFYSDPTHRQFFGLYSFSYLVRCQLFERGVPEYGGKPPFSLVGVELRFVTEIGGRRVRKVLRALQRVVNASPHRQEVFEAFFARFVSCYDITFELQRE